LVHLYAALDESSGGYCALVVGDKAAIDQLVRKLPKTFAHMVSWRGGDNEKKEVVNRLDFEGKCPGSLCKIRIEGARQKNRRSPAGWQV